MPRYDEEFKRTIVELNKAGPSARGLAIEYGLSEVMIYKWKNLYFSNQSTELTGKEVIVLKKESERLKEKMALCNAYFLS